VPTNGCSRTVPDFLTNEKFPARTDDEKKISSVPDRETIIFAWHSKLQNHQ
jgi:hypothetical protein